MPSSQQVSRITQLRRLREFGALPQHLAMRRGTKRGCLVRPWVRVMGRSFFLTIRHVIDVLFFRLTRRASDSTSWYPRQLGRWFISGACFCSDITRAFRPDISNSLAMSIGSCMVLPDVGGAADFSPSDRSVPSEEVEEKDPSKFLYLPYWSVRLRLTYKDKIQKETTTHLDVSPGRPAQCPQSPAPFRSSRSLNSCT